MSTWMNIKEVARALGVSVTSVRALVRQGKLEKHKLAISAGAHAARYDSADVERLKLAQRPATEPLRPPPGSRPRRPRQAAIAGPAPGRRSKALIDFG